MLVKASRLYDNISYYYSWVCEMVYQAKYLVFFKQLLKKNVSCLKFHVRIALESGVHPDIPQDLHNHKVAYVPI